jgi:hypothetical protein
MTKSDFIAASLRSKVTRTIYETVERDGQKREMMCEIIPEEKGVVFVIRREVVAAFGDRR